VAQPDIAARLDRLPITRLHVFIVALCAVGLFFDVFEIALGNALSAVFSAPPLTASSLQLSLLLASLYIGAAVGAPLSGYLADRTGRKKILVGVLVWLAVTSTCGAAAKTLPVLIVCRGLSGLAIGAYWPLVVAYLTDILPPRRRGTLIFVMMAMATLAPVGGIFLIRWLTPLQPMGIEAWRWTLLFGSAGTALAAIAFLFLPESARWLKACGYDALAEAACARLERSAVLLRNRHDWTPLAQTHDASAGDELPTAPYQTLQPALFGLLFFLSPWSTVAFPLLSGAVLMQKGYRLADALLYVALSFFGPFIGTIAAASVVDLVTRRTALTLCAIVMIASGYLFCAGDSRVILVAAGFVFMLFCVFYVTILNVYTGEIFSTRSRASAVSRGWALNRVGAVLAPPILLPLMHSVGPTKMFSAIAATLVLSVALLLGAPRGPSRQPVR